LSPLLILAVIVPLLGAVMIWEQRDGCGLHRHTIMRVLMITVYSHCTGSDWHEKHCSYVPFSCTPVVKIFLYSKSCNVWIRTENMQDKWHTSMIQCRLNFDEWWWLFWVPGVWPFHISYIEAHMCRNLSLYSVVAMISFSWHSVRFADSSLLQ
jgi:hypothetical protein